MDLFDYVDCFHQFDIDDQPAADGAVAPAAAGDDSGDDDLLDIEKMLEDGDAEPELEEGDDAPDIVADDDDLSLTMEAALEDAAQGAEDELDLDFDIESELQEKEDLMDSRARTDDALESNLLDGDDGIDDRNSAAGDDRPKQFIHGFSPVLVVRGGNRLLATRANGSGGGKSRTLEWCGTAGAG